MSIGNGELSNIKSISSTIANLYFHGIIGVEDWSALRKCCPEKTYQELAFCDFSKFITYDKDGNPVSKINGDDCGERVAKYAFWNWYNSDKLDVYNIYQDCYQQKGVIFGSRKKIKNARRLREQYLSQSANGQNVYQKNPNPNVNDYSSDPLGGFACWASTAATTYLNTPDVRDALHIPSYVPKWDECNMDINENYQSQHNDTSSVFQQMIDSNYPLRILIYNGDVDTACDFLADQWFIEELAEKNKYNVSVKRDAWWFRQQIAGYWKQFQGGKITIDQITVKGAGHLVPLDRPGPSLQMINNFLQNRNYSHGIEFNLAEGNLLPQYSIEQQISIAANYQSTDAINGFYCHDGSAIYLNRLDVKKALHVDETITWESCNDYMNAHYVQMHNDTTSVFNSIIASQYPLRFLIYNGDVDMACEFLGDQWFVRNLVKINNGQMTSPRAPWTFNYPTFYPRIAGFTTSFKIQRITIDQATVKGAGHFVPEDRSQQMLQLLTNFVKNTGNFSIANPMAKTQPLLPNVAPKQVSTISRKDADKIYNLPGLTYTLNFNQYSGYLNSAKGDYLHYWFIESQGQPSQDPVILWLTGGPGCSSLGSLLTEIGAFHINSDGKTLFENVYSWNKFTNILFLESPREVGFSYHNTTENPSNNIDDYQTAVENANALMDFFNNVFPEYKNNDFYITGESYAGVYIPVLSLELLNRKLGTNGFAKTMDWLNFKGFSIGNGELSEYMDVRTSPDVLYFHGLLGKSEYDAIQSCCPKSQLAQGSCHYDELVQWDSNGNLLPLNSSDPTSVLCARLINDIAGYRKWTVVNDVYNMYQNCYEQTVPSFGSAAFMENKNNVRRRGRIMASLQNKKINAQALFINQLSKINYASTDAQGGFQCYMSNGMESYLNQVHVRDAIHIPDYVQKFQFCSDTLNYTSLMKYYSLKNTFKSMMALNYPLRTLIYNGDVDLACGMMESQFFVEDLYNDVKNVYQSNHSTRKEWTYQYSSSYYPTLAGYQKSYKMTPNFSLDLLTVKGGSHFVPTSRPAQALQMIYNFISNTGDYSLSSGIDITRQPLLPQYQVSYKYL